MNLGFLGTGMISSAMVTGLSSSGAAFQSIRVSPRNHQTAADLARRFPGVSIASSNQDVLNSSDTVVLAVRPAVVRAVLSELHFRPGHRVISLVSGLSLENVSSLVAPAARVTRAVPLPSTAQRIGQTAIYPPDRFVRDLFAAIGTVVEAESEAEFDAICAATATIAAFYAFLDGVASWLSANGMPEAKARDYIAQMFLGEITTASGQPDESFQSLANAHSTAGGINELFLRHLSERGFLASIPEGLDMVMKRIRPTPGK
jgi:pyrroline-5-carboxylate reductase